MEMQLSTLLPQGDNWALSVVIIAFLAVFLESRFFGPRGPPPKQDKKV